MRKHLVVLAALVLLAACAQLQELGLDFRDPNQQLIAGYATAEHINREATRKLKEKKMSSADGQNVLETTRAARRGLDLAAELQSSDPKSAADRIAAQGKILDALNEYVKARGGK